MGLARMQRGPCGRIECENITRRHEQEAPFVSTDRNDLDWEGWSAQLALGPKPSAEISRDGAAGEQIKPVRFRIILLRFGG